MTDVIADVTAALNADEAAINASQSDKDQQIAALEAQIAGWQAQIAAAQQQILDIQAAKSDGDGQLAIIARFRELAAQLAQGLGSVLVPAAPNADPSTATPVTAGITRGG